MYQLKVNDQEFKTERQQGQVLINGEKFEVDLSKLTPSFYHVLHHNKSYNAEVVSFDAAEKTALIKVNGNEYTISARDQFDLLLDQLGMSDLNSARIADVKAPMPGLVLNVFVNNGDHVKKGDNLFILEAMKMENMIKAPADGVVKAVKVSAGDKVEKGQVLIAF